MQRPWPWHVPRKRGPSGVAHTRRGEGVASLVFGEIARPSWSDGITIAMWLRPPTPRNFRDLFTPACYDQRAGSASMARWGLGPARRLACHAQEELSRPSRFCGGAASAPINAPMLRRSSVAVACSTRGPGSFPRWDHTPRGIGRIGDSPATHSYGSFNLCRLGLVDD